MSLLLPFLSIAVTLLVCRIEESHFAILAVIHLVLSSQGQMMGKQHYLRYSSIGVLGASHITQTRMAARTQDMMIYTAVISGAEQKAG